MTPSNPVAAYIPAVTIPFPFAIRPMLPKQRREPFDGAYWLFEPKWDGWRALAMARDGRVMILSRNGRDLTRGFHGVAEGSAGFRAGR